MADSVREFSTECRVFSGLNNSFLEKVAQYVERCHLEDGGYFFARVPPSNGMDTYFAIKSLSILGLKPDQPQATAGFFLDQMKEGWLDDVIGMFLATEVFSELGQVTDDFKRFAGTQVMSLQNTAGGFGALENIYIEVPSELEATYRATKTLMTIGADFDKEKIAGFTFNLLNPDGGYGREGHSTLASTYYATGIHRLLGAEAGKFATTGEFLRKREENLQLLFIEDIYWLTMGLANLYQKISFPDRLLSFILDCQRLNGGFSRATRIGIPTLEYTFYALSVLRVLGAL